MILVDCILENIQFFYFFFNYNFMFNKTLLLVANIKQSTPSDHWCLTK